MAVQGISGTAIAVIAAGGVFAYAGLKGYSVSTTLRDILSGKNPKTQTQTTAIAGTPLSAVSGINPIPGPQSFTGGNQGASNANAAHNQAIARGLLSKFGWGQDQMAPLIALWNQESGWNQNALNAGSGATGIPQLLPSAHAIPANWSNPLVQILWGLNYIKSTYGSPAAAWAHEQSHNWY